MKTEVYNLTELVKRHDLFYGNGETVITDSEYDRLYNKLVQYEKEFPEFKLEDSPTQRIYTILMDELGKVEHSEPLLSLEKVNNEEGLRKFLNRFDETEEITVGYKEDGLSVKLEYDNGYLQRVSTRGDGFVGEDITHSIRLLETVPNYIEYEGKVVVRGEAVIGFDVFDRVNIDGKYKSPRNLVSGSVRTLEAKIARDRGVEILVFDVLNTEELGHREWAESLQFLKGHGFKVSNTKTYLNNETGKVELIKYCTDFENTERDKLGHMIDGLVLKVGDYERRKQLGTTSKYPKWAVAYKFDSLDATTVLKGVEWTVGKTGQVTPNAILEPVEIDGVLIGKASLANYANILTRDIRLGDTVVVARANDVIPQVVSAVTEDRTGREEEIQLLGECPVCEHLLEKELGKDGKGNEAVTLYCRNIDCEEQKVRVLENFVSREAMDINGLGKVTVKSLYEAGILTDIPSIYTLKDKKDEILKLERFGEKSYEKMVNGIEKSKKQPLNRVLKGLGIRNIGNFVTDVLTKKYLTWEGLEKAVEEGSIVDYLKGVEGIGDILLVSILNAFRDPNTLDTMGELAASGLQLTQPKVVEVAEGENTLEGTFVLTGTMYKGRNDIKKDIEALGGKVTGSVSKNTDYLVLGGFNDETGEYEGSKSGKHRKAEEQGVKIISDVRVKEMIEGL